MGILKDEHHVKIAGADVGVIAETGLIEPHWRLLVDGEEVDQATRSGEFQLTGRLPDGSSVEARVEQRVFGSNEVAVVHDGEEVVRFRGFLL
jgi:hypothetical protein